MLLPEYSLQAMADSVGLAKWLKGNQSIGWPSTHRLISHTSSSKTLMLMTRQLIPWLLYWLYYSMNNYHPNTSVLYNSNKEFLAHSTHPLWVATDVSRVFFGFWDRLIEMPLFEHCWSVGREKKNAENPSAIKQHRLGSTTALHSCHTGQAGGYDMAVVGRAGMCNFPPKRPIEGTRQVVTVNI